MVYNSTDNVSWKMVYNSTDKASWKIISNQLYCVALALHFIDTLSWYFINFSWSTLVISLLGDLIERYCWWNKTA